MKFFEHYFEPFFALKQKNNTKKKPRKLKIFSKLVLEIINQIMIRSLKQKKIDKKNSFIRNAK